VGGRCYRCAAGGLGLPRARYAASVADEEDKDPLDVEGAVETLNEALSSQYRSILQFTLAAASITGFEYQGLSEQLWRFAQAELEDTRRLIEKVVALGGEPTVEPLPVRYSADPGQAVDWLLEVEPDGIEALQATIPHTGDTGDSEALEHRLEHVIMRKQEQLDTLKRARGERG
jgi:bacterioferritin